MATTKDLKALIDRSNNAPKDGWEPEDGQKFSFKVVSCAHKDRAKNGYPSWTLVLEVTKGPDKGSKARAYHGFSEEYDFINQRLLSNFKELGVSSDTVHEAAPQVVAEMLVGTTGVAVAEVRASDNPNRPFVNYEIEGSRRPATRRKKVADDEETEEEAPKKKAKKRPAKKATAKRKPKPEPEPDEVDEDELEDEFDEDDVFDPDEEDDETDEDEDELEDDEEYEDWEDEED